MSRRLSLAVGLAALSISPAYAVGSIESSPIKHHPDSVNQLDAVEVLANMRKPEASTRSQVPLSKLPLSISSLNAQGLANRGYASVPEALRFVPGASFHSSYGAFYQLQVRGFDYTPIILDGMRDERTTFNSYPLADLSDVESIEVLKGPASVLQGHSSEGGLLSITRRRAIAQRNFRTRTEYGSFGHIRNTTSLGGRLFGGINGLAGFSYQGGEGWRNTRDKRFKVYGTLSGNWEKDALDLRVSYNRDFYGTEAGLAPILEHDVYLNKDNSLFLPKGTVQSRIARDARFNNESDEMWHRNFNMMLKWKHHFSPQLRLTEHASYNDDLIDYFSTEELSYRSKTIDKDKLPSEAPYPYYYDRGDKRTYIDLDHVQLTFPLRFAHRAKMLQNQLGLDGYFYTGAVKHNFALGYDFSMMRRVSFTGYGDDDVTGPGDQSLVSVVSPKSMGYMQHKFSKASTPSVMTDHGFYLQDVAEFSDKLQAMLALRFDSYRYKWAAAVPTIGGGMEYEYPKDDAFSYITSSALSYRLGLVYTPVEGTNIYASLASIFKPERMGVDERYIYINNEGKVFTPEKNTSIFRPRSGYQAELGLRTALMSWLTLDASGFYIKLNNLVKSYRQTETRPDNSTYQQRYYAQIGSVISQGFEISLAIKPLHGLELNAGYSLTDTRYGDVVKNERIHSDVSKGTRLKYVPQHQFFTHGSYNFGKRLSGLELHYNYSYIGERLGEGSYTHEGYGLLDCGLSLQLGKGLRLGAELYNLLNTKVYTTTLGGNQPFPNAPTTYKLHLSYQL